MTSGVDVRSLLAQVQEQPAWAVIRRKAAPTAGIIGGTPSEVGSILDIPLEDGIPEPGRSADRLVAVPFRQIAERGFDAIDDGTPLVVVDITEEHEVRVDDLLAALPDVPIEFADKGGFVIEDDDYAAIVERIIADEIGQGEGANLVIGRHYRAVVADWDTDRALTVFRRLLERERGAYWTFIFFTGDRFLIGASPERHVSVKGSRDGASDVRMNPISGTFRVGDASDEEALKERLLDFLADEKEIYELFMVVDEELKMMCDICTEGGQVLGPFLKPMTHLVHTEYLLAGRSDRDPREILRDTMFAATVTGAPVENACQLISAYETEGRGYYGSALALFGRDKNGNPTMDSPILIRTADVSTAGELKVTAGATLVRDSVAAYEVAETHAKAGGILSAFGLVPAAMGDADAVAALARDEDVVLALGSRNQRLSRFWLTDQEGAPPDPVLKGKHAVILHGEDDFVNMLRHLLGVFGMTSAVVRHEDYATGAFDGADLVIVGPGPGDPRDGAHPKVAAFRRAVDDLLSDGQPFLAVCLGHQTLCERLGIPLVFKDIVFQGTQSPIDYDGRVERVGFYNTFVGRVRDGDALPDGVTVQSDEATGDVHLLSGPHYRGIQFHAESILTEHGYDLIHDLVQGLVGDSLLIK
ncbi:MAG: Anthranilate synthase component and chorismate binding protein [Nocardioides sp.]|jgi:phenazine biosynthesis protein phzE|uniref:anthranilate synthase family protein n=1 Tax=Nocardioides sp. TaxID=35761 RepID=UPI002615C069|nr:chorismate-binding protein [Nocardioides sp.]MCW2834803.1 Anthranilate synthase component and chorismate binding protein [Nocardioides sp.]